jgi:hypothetical protein
MSRRRNAEWPLAASRSTTAPSLFGLFDAWSKASRARSKSDASVKQARVNYVRAAGSETRLLANVKLNGEGHPAMLEERPTTKSWPHRGAGQPGKTRWMMALRLQVSMGRWVLDMRRLGATNPRPPYRAAGARSKFRRTSPRRFLRRHRPDRSMRAP